MTLVLYHAEPGSRSAQALSLLAAVAAGPWTPERTSPLL